jgi:aquaporin Z
MLISLFTELIGTFVFLSVIIKTGQAVPIGVALAAVIFMGGSVSGGHFNPAVSVMMYFNKKIDISRLIGYVVTQCLAGLCALLFYKTELGMGAKRAVINAFRSKK